MTGPREVNVGSGELASTQAPALIMVDCQRLFTLGALPGTRLEAAVLAAGDAARRAREAGMPVIWLRTVYQNLDELGPVWRVKAPALAQLLPGAEMTEFDERAGYRTGEAVITKKRASGFLGTDLHELLTESGIRTLAVAGFTTGGCVRATVVDGASLDYLPVVFADAVADRGQAVHDAALVDLDARYADVANSPDWFAEASSRV